MTWKGCVGGSWFLELSPPAKQGTQRSYSWQAGCAQEIRTYTKAKALESVTCIVIMFATLTVDVTSIEHTSQWNLVPASVPREAVFFRITPIGLWALSSSTESEAVAETQNRPPDI